MTPAHSGSTSSSSSSRARVSGLVFCLLLAIYLLTAKGFSDLQDAETTYLMTRNLVERGSVALPTSGVLVTEALDTGHARRGQDGRLYALYGLGYPLFLVPWYLLGKGAAFIAHILGAQSAGSMAALLPRAAVNLSLAFQIAFLGVILCQLLWLLTGDLRLSLGATLLFALGTPFWVYSKAGFYEPFIALCLLLCFYSFTVYALRQPHGAWLSLAGFALGWAVATKPSALLAAPVFLFYVLWRRGWPAPAQMGFRAPLWRELGLFCLGLLPWLALMLLYNQVRFGSPLDLGYTRGFYAPSSGTPPYLLQLYGFLLGPGRGLFIYCPLVLIALIGWRAARQEFPAEMWTVLLLAAAYLFYHAASAPDRFAWGPRYLLPALPFLMLPLPWGLRALSSGFLPRTVLVFLLVTSMTLQVLGIIVPYGTWLGRVHAQTHSSQTVVYQWRHFPPLGQIKVLAEVQTTPLHLSDAWGPEGLLSKEFKIQMRHSLDFWWFYAWRLGLPRVPVLFGMTVLLAMVVVSALGLRRSLPPISGVCSPAATGRRR